MPVCKPIGHIEPVMLLEALVDQHASELEASIICSCSLQLTITRLWRTLWLETARRSENAALSLDRPTLIELFFYLTY